MPVVVARLDTQRTITEEEEVEGCAGEGKTFREK